MVGFPGHRNRVIATDIVHHRIQQGVFYTVSVGNLAIVNDGELNCLVITPASEPEIHLRPRAKVGGDAELLMFEDTIVSANGTETPPINQNRLSASSPSVVAFSGPTITDDGLQLSQEFLPGGTGGSSPGGGGSFYVEWVLKPSTTYLVRLINRAGNAQPAAMQLEFYETFGLDLG